MCDHGRARVCLSLAVSLRLLWSRKPEVFSWLLVTLTPESGPVLQNRPQSGHISDHVNWGRATVLPAGGGTWQILSSPSGNLSGVCVSKATPVSGEGGHGQGCVRGRGEWLATRDPAVLGEGEGDGVGEQS